MEDYELNEKDLKHTNASVAIQEVGSVDIDPIEERKLLKKLDFYIVSILGLLYLFSFLDRSNIGNANLAGLSTDLHLNKNKNEYGTAVSVVYATYVAFEPVFAVLLKIVGPKRLLAVSTMSWGILTISTAFAKNFKQLVTLRVLLGIGEAALFPCLNIFLTMCYSRAEIGRRLSFVFCCAAISGALGGLLAFGLTQINTPHLKGWQFLYVIEGAISLAFAPIAYFAIPNTLTQAWFLNPEERLLVHARIGREKAYYDPNDKFSWGEVRRGLKDWKTWVLGVNQFAVDFQLYAISTFMPSIIKSMGIASTVHSQLLTVPVYFVGACSFLIVGYFSDKIKMRSPFLIGYGVTSTVCHVFLAMLHQPVGLIATSLIPHPLQIGFIILAVAKLPGVRFFGLFLTAIGLYSNGLGIAWVNSISAGHFKRATTSGMMQLVGSMALLQICASSFLAMMLKRINAKRAVMVEQGAEDDPALGDENPHFVYYL